MGSGLPERRRYNELGLIILVLWVALAVRLNEMRGDNLWLDEAVEFNVANRPFQEVIAADQAMTHDPPLFSLILNLWMQIGRDDFYLQTLPIIISVFAVAVMFVLGRQIFSPGVGLLGAFVAAVAPRSVYYGQELNQYALVSVFAALCPLLLERYLRRPMLNRLLPFVGVMVAAILTHYELALYGMALVLIGTFNLLRRYWKSDRRLLIGWAAGLGVLAVIGVGLLWLYALPQKARLPAEFAPVRFNGPVSLSTEIQGWLSQSIELLRFLFWGFESTPLHWVTLILFVIGILVSLRASDGHRAAAYLLTSMAIGYMASGFGFLIYAGRYAWYAFPFSVLLTCTGILLIGMGRLRRALMPVSIGISAVLVCLLVARLPSISGQPFPETELFGDVLRYVEAHRLPGDTIYVYYGARQAFMAYASEDLAGVAFAEKWSRGLPLDDQRARMWAVLGARPRVWILLSHVYPGEGANLLDALHAQCRQLDVIQFTNAAGYLFDCTSRTDRHLPDAS